jgi:hypothetical protein
MVRSFSLVLMSAALASCVDTGDEGMVIVKNVYPGDECVFEADERSLFISRGTYATLSRLPYYMHPQLKSRVTASEGQETQRTIYVKGARVELSFTDTELFTAAELDEMRTSGITRFETRLAAPLSPNGGITDTSVELIYPNLLERIVEKYPEAGDPTAPSFHTEVIASVVMFGELAGSEVTSQKYEFPVTICNDCVVNVMGACPLPPETELRKGNACSPFQDGVVDCCSDGDTVVCPARLGSP